MDRRGRFLSNRWSHREKRYAHNACKLGKKRTSSHLHHFIAFFRFSPEPSIG
jgi:hypothetical protein